MGYPARFGLLPLSCFKGNCWEQGETRMDALPSPVPETRGTARAVDHFQGASLDVETSLLKEGREQEAPSLHHRLQRCENFLKVQFQPRVLCPRLMNNIRLPGPDTRIQLLQT